MIVGGKPRWLRCTPGELPNRQGDKLSLTEFALWPLRNSRARTLKVFAFSVCGQCPQQAALDAIAYRPTETPTLMDFGHWVNLFSMTPLSAANF